MEVTDRELVPFSRTRAGTEIEIGERREAGDPRAARSITVVSGGYEDDVAESYDDLAVVGSRQVAGHRVTLLEGSLLQAPVRLAVWRDENIPPPCDVHAVVAVNLSPATFRRLLDSVELRTRTN